MNEANFFMLKLSEVIKVKERFLSAQSPLILMFKLLLIFSFYLAITMLLLSTYYILFFSNKNHYEINLCYHLCGFVL